jgi:hypothetical protein
MSTDFEQRLRAEMEQVQVSPRPGLVNEAYRGYRGKRRLTRALAATGAAMAIAAGTAAGVAATASPTAIPAQTSAYVVSHVSSALATSDDISYTIITNPPENNTQVVLYNWHYGTRWRQSERDSGQPEWDNWGQNWGQPDGYQIVVLYPQRSWERIGETIPGSEAVPSFACQDYGRHFFELAAAEPADLSSVIKSGLQCGAFQLAGHQQVDGTDTIKLTAIVEGKPAFTLLVDARTYLPVQLTADGAVMQFRWLSPTQANLAQLTGTIPPGFHRHD